MTKVFSIIAVAVLATSFVACGPSAEEKAKMEEQAKRTADSISAALSASLEGAMNEATAPAADSTAAPAATETATTEAHAH
jgi:hypothetical protein